MGLHPVTDAVCETVSAWSEGPQRLQSLRENWERTAGPSTALRSGPTAGRDRRDDTSVSGLGVCYGEFGRAEGRTADPSTTLGMTKGTAALPFRFDSADDERQVLPLRHAPGRDDTSVSGLGC
jgi:hypothetical protein